MKWIIALLAVAVLTATFTYLVVSNQFQRKRAAELASELARIKGEQARQTDEADRAMAMRIPQSEAPTSADSRSHLRLSLTSGSPTQAVSSGQGESPGRAQIPSPIEIIDTRESALPVIVPTPVSRWARFTGTTGSVCTVRGNSSAGSWEFESRVIGGQLCLDSRLLNPTWATDMLKVARKGLSLPVQANSAIPVWSLLWQRPAGDSTMHEVVNKHLNQAPYSKIEYRLAELSLKPNDTNFSGILFCHSEGILAIAGVTNLVRMPVSIEPLSHDHLRIIGVATLRLADFNVKPLLPAVQSRAIILEETAKVTLTWILSRDDRIAVNW